MYTVSATFDTAEKAVAFLTGAKKAGGTAATTTKPVKDELGGLGEEPDGLGGLGEDEDDLGLGGGEPAKTKTLKEQIQEAAAKISAADKKDLIRALFKRVKVGGKAITKIQLVPADKEAPFLVELNKIITDNKIS